MQIGQPAIVSGACGYGCWRENSLEGFKQSLEQGVDAVEIDAHLTADGHVVLHHDYRLNPDQTRLNGEWIAGPGPVIKTLSLKELRRYDVGRTRPSSKLADSHPNWPQQDGIAIATLPEVLAILASRSSTAQIYVEIKTSPQQPEESSDYIALSNAVIDSLETYHLVPRARVIAFDWRVLRHIRSVRPDLALSHLSIPPSLQKDIIRDGAGDFPWADGCDPRHFANSIQRAIAAHGGRCWSAHFSEITADGVAAAAAAGLSVAAWGLSLAPDIGRFAEMGLESLTVSGPCWGRGSRMNANDGHETSHGAIQEAVGPSLPIGQASAAIAIGVVALLLAGVLPAVLGALADEHRLSAAGIGQCATLEALSMAITTAWAGAFLKPRKIKMIAALAGLVLAAINAGTMKAAGNELFALRALAGIPEGIMLWVPVSMIARSKIPERWAAIFFTVLMAAQFGLAFWCTVYVLPRFGADGAYAALAAASLAAVPIALFAPSTFAPLPKSNKKSGIPPPRGLLALLATLLYVSAANAVSVYLVPIAHQAGLTTGVANTAIWVSLASQIAGGALATVIAGRIRYIAAFAGSTVAFIAVWFVFSLQIPAWAFISANALSGLALLFISPFMLPMAIEADPSRRAAMQSAGVQVLAAALGPLLASLLVDQRDAHGALILGGWLLAFGLILIVLLHLTSSRKRLSGQR